MTVHQIKSRNWMIWVFCVALFVSCTKQNGTSAVPGTGTVDTATAQLKYSGHFMNGPYGSVSGTAKIFYENATYLLKLQSVSISNGPDLHVYISKERNPVHYIDLGKLQSISGDQVYQVPGNPDFLTYQYTLIHCKQFNHLFGSALLR